jgi:hypothetical protein
MDAGLLLRIGILPNLSACMSFLKLGMLYLAAICTLVSRATSSPPCFACPAFLFALLLPSQQPQVQWCWHLPGVMWE